MFQEALKDYKTLIDEKIDTLYPDLSLPYDSVLKASRYSLTLGGKRIRPILTTEFCKLFGGNINDAFNFAVAIEMIHTYSLIHDDLPCMDNDDMRRGHPSCHKAYGEDTALLAGDTLLTEAFSVASKAELSPEQICDAIRVITYYAGLHGMIGGQVLDLSFEKSKPNAEQLVDMYERKTSGLLIAACKLGAISSNNYDKASLKIVSDYAKNLGIAFQIIDDILDCTADESILGKPVGSDNKNEKTTFVAIFGIDKAQEYAREYTDKAITALNKLNGDKTFLLSLTNYLLKRNY